MKQHQPIAAGQTLTARSVGDYDCIFSVEVVSRTEKSAIIVQDGKTKRTKIHTDSYGDEYVRPERYSFAPMFRAPKIAAPVFTVVK